MFSKNDFIRLEDLYSGLGFAQKIEELSRFCRCHGRGGDWQNMPLLDLEPGSTPPLPEPDCAPSCLIRSGWGFAGENALPMPDPEGCASPLRSEWLYYDRPLLGSCFDPQTGLPAAFRLEGESYSNASPEPYAGALRASACCEYYLIRPLTPECLRSAMAGKPLPAAFPADGKTRILARRFAGLRSEEFGWIQSSFATDLAYYCAKPGCALELELRENPIGPSAEIADGCARLLSLAENAILAQSASAGLRKTRKGI